ncbi:hypothetical protein ACJIZ3_007770 [Penstemon smallii]|uniref:Yippee domain-containing protein n=1 Tax=Penstemon smallii TaxID=265156 RepID=A0ABD3T7X2_9LAMI
MDNLPLITCNQDKTSHFFLCLCKTAVALYEDMVTKDCIGRDIYFDKMFNVELSDIRRKIEYETKHINCAKCGEHLGHKRVRIYRSPRPNFSYFGRPRPDKDPTHLRPAITDRSDPLLTRPEPGPTRPDPPICQALVIICYTSSLR